jgi:hypothetical protein
MGHGLTQEPIGLGLITAALSFEPGNDVGIEAYRYGLLLWPIELAHFGTAPVEDWSRIGKINLFVSFAGDDSDVSFLLFCELPHTPSFHAIRQRVPR